jgi:hypothetical protein
MNRWGCFGFILGGLMGLLTAILLLVVVRQLAAPLPTSAPPPVPADVTLFLSERILSRSATVMRKSPTMIDLEPGGRMEIATQVEVEGFKPVVNLGLSLQQMPAGQVVSRLDWVKIGFIKIPALWLPESLTHFGAEPGQVITQQTPPGFQIVGITTTADGFNFQLNWIGP